MGDGKTFDLVVSRESPGTYERAILATPHESENTRLIRCILGGAGTLIDLGANIGTIAIPIGCTGSRVLAVEMLPENCLKLGLSVLANRLSRVRVVQAAASETDGVLNFDGTEAWGAVANDGSQRAVALSLDTIVASALLAEPDFLDGEIVLKMDIEGYEHQALLGAGSFLKRRPIVLFESVETEGEPGVAYKCKAVFESLDYRLFMIRATVLVPKFSRDVQEEYVSDFLAVPAEKIEAVKARLRGVYEFRTPEAEEAIAWMQASAFHSPNHRTHVSRVVERLAKCDPTFAAKAEALRVRLESPDREYLFQEFPRTADLPAPKPAWWRRFFNRSPTR